MKEKLRIAICDDEKNVAEELEKLISALLSEMKADNEITLYQSGESLLAHIEETQVVFLDIDMPGMDGIAVGRQICAKNPRCFIIMETGVDRRVREAFQIGAIRSLAKPFDERDVREALETVLDRMIGSKTITVYSNRQPFEVEQRDIVYARAINSQVELFTEGQTYRRAATMDQLEKELDSRLFYRIHRQYLVNLKYITRKPGEKVKVNGQELPVARDRKSGLIYAWMEFDLKYRRGM